MRYVKEVMGCRSGEGGGDDSGSVCICLGGEELHWGHREKGVVIIIVVYFITNIRGVVTFTANSKT